MNSNLISPSTLLSPEKPWLGLAYFTEQSRDYFFGRGKELEELFSRVTRKSLTVLYGQSGLGKTSLLRAALMPRLFEAGFHPIWIRAIHRPLQVGENPSLVAEDLLVDALSSVLPETCKPPPQGHGPGRLWQLLHDREHGLCRPGMPRLVLILDAFEEFYTHGDSAECRPISDALHRLLSDTVENRVPPFLADRMEDEAFALRFEYSAQPLKILLSLRDDYLHRLERWRPEMPSLMDNRQELLPWNGLQALEAVVNPASLRCGPPLNLPPIVDIQTAGAIVGVVAGIQKDQVPPPLRDLVVAPSLLSLFCRELNAKRGDKPCITADVLTGSKESILEGYYERCFTAATQSARVFVEEHLISPGGYRQVANRDSFLDFLQQPGAEDDVSLVQPPKMTREEAEATLNSLINEHRLLVAEERGRVPRVELTHDTLAPVVRRSRIKREAAEIEMRRSSADKKRRLEEEEKEKKNAAERQARSAHRAAILWAIAAMALLILGVWAHIQRGVATKALDMAEKNLALSRLEEGRAWFERAKAAQARGENFQALFAAGRAVGFDGFGRPPGIVSSSSNMFFPALMAAPLSDAKHETERQSELFELRKFSRSIHPMFLPLWSSPAQNHHDGLILCIAYSPDGTRLASGSSDKSIKVWDLASGKEIATLEGHKEVVNSLAFSPDGTRLASGSDDKSIKVWEVGSGKEITTLEGHKAYVFSVAFSPNGRQLASGSWDKSIKLWEVVSGKEIATLEGHQNAITSVAFSPDGTRLASGSRDNSIMMWEVASGKEIATLAGHEDWVRSVAFSPDGTRLASGSGDYSIKVWELATGKEIVRLEGHTKLVSSVAFSPDGTRLASGSGDHSIKMWDVSSGKEIATLVGHQESVWSVAFSPDGTRLASGSSDHSIKVWEVSSGKEIVPLEGHNGWVQSVAFSPDGTRLASGVGDGSIKLWEVFSGKEIISLEGHRSSVQSLAFSPDGTRLANGSGDKSIKVWEVASGKEIATLEGHENAVYSVAFSPDGTRLASGAGDNSIKVWEVSSGKVLAMLEGHNGPVWSVAFSLDGTRLASGSGDSSIKLWDLASGKEIATLAGHEDWVWSVAFSPDGTRLASGSGDNSIKVWEVSSGNEITTLEGHNGSVLSVAFSPEGTRLASGSEDGSIKVWDVSSGKEIATLEGHNAWVRGLAFSPDGTRLTSGSADDSIKLWDVSSGKEIATLVGHKESVWSVAFSPDGTRLASGSEDKSIKVWEVSSGKEIATLEGHKVQVTSVAFSPDGTRLASGSEDKSIKVWEVSSGKEIATLEGHKVIVTSVAFSPDGTRLASGSWDNSIKVWEVSSGKEIATLEGQKGIVLSVAFSPDGTRLASGSADDSITLWEVSSGKEIATLEGHKEMVWSVVFNPDGTRLASGSGDNSIKLWEVSSGKEIATLEGHKDSVWSVAFSPDGTRLASGSGDNSIKLWEVSSGKEIATLEGHKMTVSSVAFSPDGTRLASGSSDKSIKLWPVCQELDLWSLIQAGLVQMPSKAKQASSSGLAANLYKARIFPVFAFRDDTFGRLCRPGLSRAAEQELKMTWFAEIGNVYSATSLWHQVKLDRVSVGSPSSAIRRTYISLCALRAGDLLGSNTNDAVRLLREVSTAITPELWQNPTISLGMLKLGEGLLSTNSLVSTAVSRKWLDPCYSQAPPAIQEALVERATRDIGLVPRARVDLRATVEIVTAWSGRHQDSFPLALARFRTATPGEQDWEQDGNAVLSSGQTTGEAVGLVAYLAACAGKTNLSERAIQVGLDRFPSDAKFRVLAGWASLNSGKFAEALRHLDTNQIELDGTWGKRRSTGTMLALWLIGRQKDAVRFGIADLKIKDGEKDKWHERFPDAMKGTDLENEKLREIADAIWNELQLNRTVPNGV